ncbi:MAG TPA: DUF58 domain-containing protein [Planctomycetota bacterium]|nr:DUF58 domain-containing protein [Planctomycetota bacterium]
MAEGGEDLAELLKEVRRIKVRSERLAAEVLAGGYGSVFRGAGVEFKDVREYEEGDDPRAVDWNVSARLGRPFVKRFVDERELTLLLVVDVSPRLSAGFSGRSPRHAAAVLAACLAFSAVKNQDKVGMVSFGAGARRFLPPRKGAGHALRLVRDALFGAGGGGPPDLAAALDLVGAIQRRRAVVFVVSDFLEGGYEKALARCGRRHDLTIVRLRPPELDAPPDFLMRARDPRSGATRLLDFGDARFRAAFRARADAARRASDDAARRAGAESLEVPLPRVPDVDAVMRPLVAYFRRRASRGARR